MFESYLHLCVFRPILALLLLHLTLLSQTFQPLLESPDLYGGPLEVHCRQNLLVWGVLWRLEFDRDYHLDRCMRVMRAVSEGYILMLVSYWLQIMPQGFTQIERCTTEDLVVVSINQGQS